MSQSIALKCTKIANEQPSKRPLKTAPRTWQIGQKHGGLKVRLPLDDLEEFMSLTAGSYGRMIGVKYAEGFLVKEIFGVEDVVQMPVRSM